MDTLRRSALHVAVSLTTLPAGLTAELQRRWRALRRNDQGVESVEVAVAIALGLALALLLWGAYKVLIEKYVNQVQ